MSIADRYRVVAGGFSERVDAVDEDAWERPAPPEGWNGRDIVVHVVEWMPAFIAAGSELRFELPDPQADPRAAWYALDETLAALLDDPDASAVRVNHPFAGSHRLDEAIATFMLGDLLVHTWDLARAAGLDDALDPDEVATLLAGLRDIDQGLLRDSGQYGAAFAVAADAPLQDQLIAFTGRDPSFGR